MVVYYVVMGLLFLAVGYHFAKISYTVWREYHDAVYRRDDVLDIWLDALVNGLKR